MENAFRPEALSVKFAGLDIAEISALMALTRLNDLFRSASLGAGGHGSKHHPERAIVAQRTLYDPRGANRGDARSWAGLSVARTKHADPFPRRIAAAPLGQPAQIRSNLFRRRLRAG